LPVVSASFGRWIIKSLCSLSACAHIHHLLLLLQGKHGEAKAQLLPISTCMRCAPRRSQTDEALRGRDHFDFELCMIIETHNDQRQRSAIRQQRRFKRHIFTCSDIPGASTGLAGAMRDGACHRRRASTALRFEGTRRLQPVASTRPFPFFRWTNGGSLIELKKSRAGVAHQGVQVQRVRWVWRRLLEACVICPLNLDRCSPPDRRARAAVARRVAAPVSVP